MKKKSPEMRKGRREGTPAVMTPISNAVLARRKAKGLGQGELAERVGLTRQAMYDIEANHYLPSTAIALRLAQTLECRVEDLFSLSKKGEVIEAELIGDTAQSDRPIRVNLARVGNRIIARPLSELGDVLNFVVSADGIVTAPPSQKRGKIHQQVQVELLHDRQEIDKRIVIAGCDPSMFIAGGHVRHLQSGSGIINWTMGSANALQALLQGEVHIAGVHLVDARSGESNIPYLKRHVQGKEYVGIRFASWVQGIMVKRGNPKGIRTIEDFGQPDLRLINREPGAGARFFLDARLKKTGISGQQVEGYHHVVTSHLEVARVIRDGLADVGIGVEAAALHFGLDFIPLQEERYDLILRKDVLASHPTIPQLLDAMVSRPFRQEVETLGGYNLTEIGQSLSW